MHDFISVDFISCTILFQRTRRPLKTSNKASHLKTLPNLCDIVLIFNKFAISTLMSKYRKKISRQVFKFGGFMLRVEQIVTVFVVDLQVGYFRCVNVVLILFVLHQWMHGGITCACLSASHFNAQKTSFFFSKSDSITQKKYFLQNMSHICKPWAVKSLTSDARNWEIPDFILTLLRSMNDKEKVASANLVSCLLSNRNQHRQQPPMTQMTSVTIAIIHFLSVTILEKFRRTLRHSDNYIQPL